MGLANAYAYGILYPQQKKLGKKIFPVYLNTFIHSIASMVFSAAANEQRTYSNCIIIDLQKC